MSRHGLKFCLICNPEGNGTKGEEGTEAIGKYYLEPGPNQVTSGWIPVCEWCASSFEHIQSIIPIKGKESHSYWVKKKEEALAEEVSAQANQELLTKGTYKHDWDKEVIVTSGDYAGFGDPWKCKKCGARIIFRMGMNRPEYGCSVKGDEP